MAADRWWGGIPAGAYSHENFTFMATAAENTYLDSITLIVATAAKTATFQLMGTKKGDAVTSALIDPITIGTAVPITIPLHLELEPATICYMLVSPLDADSVVSVIRVVFKSGTEYLTESAWIHGQMGISSGDRHVIAASLDPAGTTQVNLDTLVDAHAVTIPALQGTPAAIDELEVLSDSASDTQDIIIDYWDDAGAEHSTAAITMTGTTPVVVGVVTYDDIWVVKGVRVNTGEAAAAGNIILTDTST